MPLDTERRPALVPTATEYANQRRFHETRHGLYEAPGRYAHDVQIDVYRDGNSDIAQVRIDLTQVLSARIQLCPDNLRRLASDLLDAAADIEANPAAVLREAYGK